MKFACLGYFDENAWNSMSSSQRDALVAECLAYDDLLVSRGYWVEDGGAALESVQSAKILRGKDGKTVVTDGPFVETKEQLGGLGVLEARDMDEAVEVMSQHPGVGMGPFEIRPIDGELTERCKPATGDAATPSAGAEIVCLGYGDESRWDVMPPHQREALLEEYIAFGKVLGEHGQSVGGMALQSVRAAKTVRSKAGKIIVTDGPYAETKEHLGGVAIFRFADMDRAVEAWSNHPCLRVGDVLELRPTNEQFNARWEAQRKGRLSN